MNKLNSISIVPNPTNEMVRITFDGTEAQLTIFDLKGKVVATMNVNSGDKVDMSAYENGMYIFNLYSGSSRTIERVVKQ